ncbi:NAD(P)/FAD-dependent oxidoreductase [Salinisphaera sp. T31B1]|uniref:flavin-containing monooxygenase n=1 Tax=Salinisphaera sp. T31B1 TaxID=727963 RepID=UPI003342322A
MSRAQLQVTSAGHTDADVARPGTAERVHEVAVIGAGLAGLGTAVRLCQHGIDDLVVLERTDAPGGQWPTERSGPPAKLYRFSFAPGPEAWQSHRAQEWVSAYVDHLIATHALASRMRFRQHVTAVRFDMARGRWTINVAGKRNVHARCVVVATGGAGARALPEIAGIDSFQGSVLHCADWNRGHELDGRRIALIGSHPDAIGRVPALAAGAECLKVFQRRPNWIVPRLNGAAGRWIKRLLDPLPDSLHRKALLEGHAVITGERPGGRVLESIARAHLAHQVPDRWLRRQLTPETGIGTTPVVMSNDYYPTLRRDNVKLYTWPIDRLCARGIRSVEGIEHRVDTIVFAPETPAVGHVCPFPVVGLDGRQLDDDWAAGVRAYKGVNIAGYPNLFFGPASAADTARVPAAMTPQIDYIVQGVATILEYDLRMLDVRADTGTARAGVGRLPGVVCRKDMTRFIHADYRAFQRGRASIRVVRDRSEAPRGAERSA